MPSNKRSKTNRWKCLVLVPMLILVHGCLDFGDDFETTSPTEQQVSGCRKAMYINTSVNITPLGLYYAGSGIDAAVWYKFRTDTVDVLQIFDTSVVDAAKFQNGFTLNTKKNVKWWDVKNKDLLGGQVPLPNAKYMNVGIEKIEEGYTVYIMWFET